MTLLFLVPYSTIPFSHHDPACRLQQASCRARNRGRIDRERTPNHRLLWHHRLDRIRTNDDHTELCDIQQLNQIKAGDRKRSSALLFCLGRVESPQKKA